MSTPNQIVLEITLEARQRLEAQAQKRGYEELGEYLLALVDADIQDEEEEDPVEGFREGWQDILNGNTYPVSTLWDDLDDE